MQNCLSESSFHNKIINNSQGKSVSYTHLFAGHNFICGSVIYLINDIIKNMVLENDDENIGSDNEMLVYVNKSERKCRKNLQLKGLQGVNFSPCTPLITILSLHFLSNSTHSNLSLIHIQMCIRDSCLYYVFFSG